MADRPAGRRQVVGMDGVKKLVSCFAMAGKVNDYMMHDGHVHPIKIVFFPTGYFMNYICMNLFACGK